MSSTSKSKRKKPSKKLDVKNEEDRISNLPNNLIGHVLSFLPTKCAVATSVLSSKWEECWKLIDSLEFSDSEEFLQKPIVDRCLLNENFINFVYRVLLLRKFSTLRKFNLDCSQYLYSYDGCHINAWVGSVLNCNIQELYLSVHVRDNCGLPKSLYTCTTLVKLKLGRGFGMNLPKYVFLPSLKVLDIDNMKLYDDESIARLLSGCPLLEELSMTSCIEVGVAIIEISAPLLRSLVLRHLSHYSRFSESGYKIVLQTPILSNLVIDDVVAENYMSKILNDLNKAHISIDRPDPEDDFPWDYCHAVDNLFEAVSGVKSLHLAGSSMEAIKVCESKLPTFQLMTDVELRFDYAAKWEVLPQLLEKSPHLRTLTFVDGLLRDHYYDEEDPDELLNFRPEKTVPNCLLYHLKLIEIHSFYGWKEELEIAQYFLENAEALEKVIVHCPSLSDSDKLMVSKKLLMLPRASRCLIELL